MSWKHIANPWPGQPDGCRCTHPQAATLEGTLRCPDPWYQLPDGTWAHARWSPR